MIIDKLYELIKTGEITEILDGGKLEMVTMRIKQISIFRFVV